MKDDAISRQAAIRWVKAECNPYGKPTLDYESGKRVMKHLEQMLSAQPEIIRCRECKEWEMYGNGCQGWCGKLGLISYDDDYCGWAERREVSE